MVGQPGKTATKIPEANKRKWVIWMSVGTAVILIGSLLAIFLPGRYEHSKDGCLNMQLPGVVGAILIHRCGVPADKFCAKFGTEAGVDKATIDKNCREAGVPL